MENLKLNEIIVRPVASTNTAIVLSSALYNIETNNTIEVRSQSVSTPTGNEHTIVESDNESVIGTKISAGELVILDTNVSNEKQSKTSSGRVKWF